VIVNLKTGKKRLNLKLKRVNYWIKADRNRDKLKVYWFKFVMKLTMHVSYYGVSFNTAAVSTFLNQSKRIFLKWINRRSQSKSLTLEQFNKFAQKYALAKANVHHPLF